MILASTPMTQGFAAALCGGFVSFSLGLVGGGGSILAVPLILYVVGVHNPHIAIGTAALAVAASAYINMIPHARAGHVRWGPAFAFAASGVLGATLGSSVGKLIDGQKLLTYFAFLMCFVAFLMLRPRPLAPATAGAYPTPHALFAFVRNGIGRRKLVGIFWNRRGLSGGPGPDVRGSNADRRCNRHVVVCSRFVRIDDSDQLLAVGPGRLAGGGGIRWRRRGWRRAGHSGGKPPSTQARRAEPRFLRDDHLGRGLYALSLMAGAMTLDQFNTSLDAGKS
jgi:hypothetical protein